jgi:hypothetical protein
MGGGCCGAEGGGLDGDAVEERGVVEVDVFVIGL